MIDAQGPAPFDDDLLAQIAEDELEGALSIPGDDGSSDLSTLIRKMQLAEEEIETLSQQLSRRKEELRKLSEQSIPAKMDELGISSIKLATGHSVTVEPFVSISIHKGREEDAHRWLDSIGAGGIVKHTISVPFARDAGEAALDFRAMLDMHGLSYVDKTKVEPQTLEAFARRRIANGESFPEEFKVYPGRYTKIQLPRKKRGY